MHRSALIMTMGLAASAGACSAIGLDDSYTVNTCRVLDDPSDLCVTDVLADRDNPIANQLQRMVAAKTMESGLSVDRGPKGDLEETYHGVIDSKSFDYWDFLSAVATQAAVDDPLDCSANLTDSIRTFLVADDLLTTEQVPRVISTICNSGGATDKKGEFFITALWDEQAQDLDLRTVEMFAWDKVHKEYKFYALSPTVVENFQGRRHDALGVEINPRRCQGCHKTPTDLPSEGMPMTPIMNELREPWVHWNAALGDNVAGIQSVGYSIPASAANASGLRRVLGSALSDQPNALRAPARMFESIIDTAQLDHVADPRVTASLDGKADARQALTLLRPLFCEEQLTYYSESTGGLPLASILDPNVGLAFGSGAEWPSTWLWRNQTGLLALAPDAASEVLQVPGRGNADLRTVGLLARYLGSDNVVRALALDWQRPVFSDFRCGLWRAAWARQTNANTADDLAVTGSTLRDILPGVFADVMVLPGGHSLLTTGSDFLAAGRVAADGSGLASAGTGMAACGADASGACRVNRQDLGELFNSFVQATKSRSAVTAIRDERIRHIMTHVAPADLRFAEQGLRPDSPAKTCDEPLRFENRPALPLDAVANLPECN